LGYLWLPRLYRLLWLLLLASGVLWYLQISDPDKYNIRLIFDGGRKLSTVFGIAVAIVTAWIVSVSWEQHVAGKGRRPTLELTLADRHYGGTVFVRRVPTRIWNAAEVGDRLVKSRWSVVIRLAQKRRPDAS